MSIVSTSQYVALYLPMFLVVQRIKHMTLCLLGKPSITLSCNCGLLCVCVCGGEGVCVYAHVDEQVSMPMWVYVEARG